MNDEYNYAVSRLSPNHRIKGFDKELGFSEFFFLFLYLDIIKKSNTISKPNYVSRLELAYKELFTKICRIFNLDPTEDEIEHVWRLYSE